MKKVLVSGSTAYDFLMKYEGNFKDQFPKGNIQQWINMSLLVPELNKTTGGTGLNICYNLSLLSEESILMSSVGYDFVFDGIVEEKVDLKYVYRDEVDLSASAYITSDNSRNQMTWFYPWAMTQAEKSSIAYIKEEVDYAIISPNKKEAMIQYVHELFDKSAKVFFDPGQQITRFSKEELLPLFGKLAYLIVNQYEYKELQEKLEMTGEELKTKFNKIIVTQGEEGCQIIDTESIIHISAIEVSEVVDTTGAGDAFRAGLIKWLKLGYGWKTSAQIGTILASYCVQHHGSQNHFFNLWVVMEDMKEKFGMNVDLYEGKK